MQEILSQLEDAPLQSLSLLWPYFDYGATLMWATSGALIAARKGYDISGIMALALVTSTGGGLLRDGLFLQHGPPVLVRTPAYLGIITAAALVIFAFGRHVQRFRLFHNVVSIVDALGLGAYAVVGMHLSRAAGLGPLGMILVGLVNAVGGVVLRDILVRQTPEIFKPGTLTTMAALAGCVEYVILTERLNVSQKMSAVMTVALVFFIRSLSAYFGYRTKPLAGFEEYWERPERQYESRHP
jgi:uncharacterized membrane protein YeiH